MHALRNHLHTALMATPDGLFFAHLHDAMVHWVWPMIGVAVAFEIGCYLLIQRRAYPWQEMLSSAAVYVMQLPMRLLQPVIVGPIAYLLWSHRLATIPLNTAWGLLLLFLGTELAYYCMHRASHEIRWLWASHVVHHTPEHLHFASAFRVGVTDLLSGTWLFYLPLFFLGLNPLAVVAVLGISSFYQFWLHTDLVGRWGPLEWILNTPAHHRVHHASNSEYLDRNYGNMLIIFDRLFGTFAQERPGTVIKYGLTHPIGSLNPVKILFHEWTVMARDVTRAQTSREKLAQVFGRPGAKFREFARPGVGGLTHGRCPSLVDASCPRYHVVHDTMRPCKTDDGAPSSRQEDCYPHLASRGRAGDRSDTDHSAE